MTHGRPSRAELVVTSALGTVIALAVVIGWMDCGPSLTRHVKRRLQ